MACRQHQQYRPLPMLAIASASCGGRSDVLPTIDIIFVRVASQAGFEIMNSSLSLVDRLYSMVS